MSETPPIGFDLPIPRRWAPDRFRDWQGLDPGCLKAWRLESAIGCLILGVALLVAEFVARQQGGFWRLPVGALSLPITVVLMAWYQRIVRVRHRAWRFRLEAEALVVRQGIWWRSTRYVPRGRIQHVDVTSGPLGRMFGIVQVSVFVAGAVGAVVTVPGLDPQTAEALRVTLLEGQDESA